jgi:type II restriction/modification system DNA methylase subunit YeeA
MTATLTPQAFVDKWRHVELNERAVWLDNAHRKLDAAVFAAYGWPVDLSDDEILSRLLALNLERAK